MKSWFTNFQEKERMQPDPREEEARQVLAQRQMVAGRPDHEIDTIAAVYRQLAALTADERARVLAYIETRFAALRS